MSQTQFYYPAIQQSFRMFPTIQGLRESIRLQAERTNLKYQYFVITYSKSKYVYLKCNKCDSRLKYRRDQNDNFRIVSFNNHHVHRSQDRSIIESYIQELPATIPISHMKTLVVNKFGIRPSKFYYLFHKVHKSNKTFERLIAKLNESGNQTRYLPYPHEKDRFPNIFLSITKQMIKNFREYGQVIAYDVTYNVVKRKKDQQKGWGLGVFWGKNCHNHIIIFGISLVNRETSQDFYGLFASFFQIMDQEPDTILTDEQHSIASALNNLKYDDKWSGMHMLDTFHIIKNLRKRIKNDKVLESLKKAIYADTEGEYHHHLVQSKKFIQSQHQAKVISEFQQKSKKICFCLSEQKFIGFSNCTSFCEKGNDIVKKYIQYQQPPVVVIEKMLRISQILEQKAANYKIAKLPYEDILKDPGLKHLRFQMVEPIFKIIIDNYIKSLSLRPIQRDNSWIFKNEQNIPVAMVSLRAGILHCDCGYFSKTLTPCSHLLNLIKYYREDISTYIDKRWRINFEVASKQGKKQSQQIKLGRPRLSRRNRS